jgi:hypothetical protein
MKLELVMVWRYIRAVFRQWWVVIVEVVLVLTDFIERIFFGTWLLPSTGTKVGIAVAALVVAQYRAYREV